MLRRSFQFDNGFKKYVVNIWETRILKLYGDDSVLTEILEILPILRGAVVYVSERQIIHWRISAIFSNGYCLAGEDGCMVNGMCAMAQD